MPTPSDRCPNGEWAARASTPKRSVFGNYAPGDVSQNRAGSAAIDPALPLPTNASPRCAAPGSRDLAIARAFIYRFLAKAYEDPAPESWQWLGDSHTREGLRAASREAKIPMLPDTAFAAGGLDSFHSAYLSLFGHAARGSCPLNEIEYADLRADPLFQPHRLADLAAFYRAFGLELAEDAGERHDHICLELEFLCVLAAKEAYAIEHQVDPGQFTQCSEAQKQFLREHLGRWVPSFTRRLAAATQEQTLHALAGFTRAFIESECARFSVNPGSEDLLLRPVDEAAERMCSSCGIPTATSDTAALV